MNEIHDDVILSSHATNCLSDNNMFITNTQSLQPAREHAKSSLHPCLFFKGTTVQKNQLTRTRGIELRTQLFSKLSASCVFTAGSRDLMLIFCDAFSNNPWPWAWALTGRSVIFHSPIGEDSFKIIYLIMQMLLLWQPEAGSKWKSHAQ